MKNGFTLLELLFVIVIVAVISISSVIVFANIDDDTSIKDRANTYMDIQRGAILYIDLNDYWLAQFKENGNIKIELSELKNSNYVDINVEDPVTNKEIPSNYMVQIYTAKDDYDNEYIDTCILDKKELLTYYCNENLTHCTESECEACLNSKKNDCSCFCQAFCNKMACVANSKGETQNCCLKYEGD